jgi:MOSC domain-containing protein YiiM
VSVNVGAPRELLWKGRLVSTAIFKEAVVGRVPVRRLNLDGDLQADPTVHGGEDKAVYAYPAEHYAFWRAELPGRELAWGTFGENLTVEGLPLEDELCIGDRLRAGSAELVVTQPRLPCFKLGLRFDDPGMVRRFLAARRTGYYLSVGQEGDVAAGDAIELLDRDPAAVSVAEITRLYVHEGDDPDSLLRAAELPALPAGWRDYFRERLAAAS